MRLYSGTSNEFVSDTARNQIAVKLETAFFDYYRYSPHKSEVMSWRNSLSAMAHVINLGELHDQGVILEYELPLSSKRLDCLLCGTDTAGQDRAVIVELKQWEKCDPCDVDKVVLSWLGGRKREVLHPSVQVGQYQRYLADSHTAFHEGRRPIVLDSCAYLHNYRLVANDPLIDSKFAPYLSSSPIFEADGADRLTDYLVEKLGRARVFECSIELIKESSDRAGSLWPMSRIRSRVSRLGCFSTNNSWCLKRCWHPSASDCRIGRSKSSSFAAGPGQESR